MAQSKFARVEHKRGLLERMERDIARYKSNAEVLSAFPRFDMRAEMLIRQGELRRSIEEAHAQVKVLDQLDNDEKRS